jgi:ABC-type lipoprotein export system ATPase subunit
LDLEIVESVFEGNCPMDEECSSEFRNDHFGGIPQKSNFVTPLNVNFSVKIKVI